MNAHSCPLCHSAKVQRAATTNCYEPPGGTLREVTEHQEDVEATDAFYCAQCGYEWDQAWLPERHATGRGGGRHA